MLAWVFAVLVPRLAASEAGRQLTSTSSFVLARRILTHCVSASDGATVVVGSGKTSVERLNEQT